MISCFNLISVEELIKCLSHADYLHILTTSFIICSVCFLNICAWFFFLIIVANSRPQVLTQKSIALSLMTFSWSCTKCLMLQAAYKLTLSPHEPLEERKEERKCSFLPKIALYGDVPKKEISLTSPSCCVSFLLFNRSVKQLSGVLHL